MKARSVLALLAALMLLVPAAALAAYPKSKDRTVVTGKSIGGLALGSSPQKDEATWGKANPKCEQLCNYSGSGEDTAEVRFETKDGTHFKAFEISIRTAVKLTGSKDLADCATPLAKYETSKGIHLCSTLGELKKAYPGLKKESTSYVLQGPGQARTTFGMDDAGKVFFIGVASHKPE